MPENKASRLQQQAIDLNGKTCILRQAIESDVLPVTELIRRTYKYWVDAGVPVSPARQTEVQTRAHILPGGYVVEFEGELCATVSLEASLPSYGRALVKPNENYLVFQKLAVDPSYARSGLGRKIYDAVESFARANKYSGMALETVAEATWLFAWYKGLGYNVVASNTYPGSSLETLLLFKKFNP